MLLTLLVPELEAAETAARVSSKPGYGGTLTIGFDHAPGPINPVITSSGISAALLSLVFDSLVQFDTNGRLTPGLAESWKISEDGLTYTFFLRPHVYFHDGAELTAEDVRFTYELIQDPKTNSPYESNFRSVKTIETAGPYQLIIRLNEPKASFIYSLVCHIAPKHLYENGNLTEGDFNRRPVGTGPFRFKEWTKNDSIVLEANEDYFAGRPYLDYVVYKTYPNRPEVWSAFMRGETDMIIFLSLEDYEITRLDPAFKTFAFATTAIYYLVTYNLHDPLLKDIRVRHAIAYAADIGRIIASVEGGYGLQASGPFSPSSPAFDPEVRSPEYDPASAAQLLAEAGWRQKNASGILEKNGTPFVFHILVDARDAKILKIASLLRQQLQEVGIALDIHRYQSHSEFSRLASGKGFQGHLSMFTGQYYDMNNAAQVWHSKYSQQGKAWLGQGVTDEIDHMIEAGDLATESQARQEIYRKLHRAISEQQPALFLYFPYIFNAVSSRIQGAEAYANSPFMPDHLIKNFYVKEDTNTNS